MYVNRSVFGLITARGGSQRIPRKNLRDLGGKPLLAWTIEAARASRYIDRLIISSEDEEILETARRYNCDVPFVRPAALAGHDTPSMEVVIHALDSLGTDPDYLMLLQPTSPFRTTAHIDDAIECCLQGGYPMLVSVERAKKHPSLMYRMEAGRLAPILPRSQQVARRQQEDVYAHNGAIYLAETAFLRRERSYSAREATGYEMFGVANLDIDEPDDLEYAAYLLAGGKAP